MTLSHEVFHHAHDTPPFAPEFRQQVVDLVRAGRDPQDIAREFEPSGQAIRNWVADADRRDGRREPKPAAVDAALTSTERDELARLRRENKQLRLERDIQRGAVLLPHRAPDRDQLTRQLRSAAQKSHPELIHRKR